MIRIDARVLAEIEAAAQRAHPYEACGLLIGNDTRLTRAVETANLARERGRGADRFEVDTRVHLRLQRELRGSDKSILGVFHSHPDGRAEPSPTDRADAAYPGWIWLITAVDNSGRCETYAFIDAGGGCFERRALDIAA